MAFTAPAMNLPPAQEIHIPIHKRMSRHERKKAVKVVYSLVRNTDWTSRPDIRKAVDRYVRIAGKQSLRSKKKAQFKKTKRLYKAICRLDAAKKQGAFSSSIRPIICTARIKSKNTAKKIRALSKRWLEIARLKKEIAASKAAHIPKKKRIVSKDSKWVLKAISKSVSGRTGDSNAIYIAYSTEGIVHGIAIATFNAKKGEIDYLGVNPDDIDILGTEQNMVRGSGTALITHIAHDILRSTKFVKKNLTLVALDSAIPFYKKLGFREKGDYYNYLGVKGPAMRNLVQNKANTHVIEENEPSASSLRI